MIRLYDYMIVYDVGRIGNTRKLVAEAKRIEGLHIENIALVPE